MAEPPQAGLIALDTNVLLGLLRGTQVSGEDMGARLAERVEAGALVAVPVFCIGELWRAATRETDPLRMSPETVRRFLDSWITDDGLLLLPGSGYWQILNELVARDAPSSKSNFDLQILAVSIEHAVTEIWTTDSRFPADSRLRTVNPLAV